jgi:hypothetical protein
MHNVVFSGEASGGSPLESSSMEEGKCGGLKGLGFRWATPVMFTLWELD